MTETKVKYRKDGQPDKRSLKVGNPYGRPKSEFPTQNETLQIRCTQGTIEIWDSYAQNLGLDRTELFYRMIYHLASQGEFISWLERDHPEQITKNPNWVESWKMVSKSSEAIIMLNKSRLKQVTPDIDTALVKTVTDALSEHYKKKY